VIWQESSRSFVHILTNSSGVTDSNLVVQSYANVSVGNVLLINNAGIYVDGTLGSAGQVLQSDGSKTYWGAPGGFTGGAVPNQTTFDSNLVVSNTTASASNVTGALVVLGGAGIGGALYIQNTGDVSANIGTLFTGNIVTNANLGAFQAFSNANAATQTISINSIVTNANANTAAYLLTATGNINAGNITTSGTSGNISGFNYIFANNYVYSNGVSILSGIGGTYSNANVASYLPTYSGNVRALNFVGAVQAQVGSSFAYALNAFGTSSDTGGVFLPADVNSNAIVAGYTIVSNAGVTLTVTSASFVAGSPNFISVSTTPTASSFVYPVTVYSADYSPALSNSTITVGNATISGNVTAPRYLFANGVNILTTVAGTYSNANVSAYLTLGANIGSGSTTSNLVAAATTTSTSTTTGALVVRGGAGIAGNVYANVFYTVDGIRWAGNGNVFASGGGGGSSNNPFDTDSNLGTVSGSVTSTFDLGLVTDLTISEFNDLGSIVSNAVIYGTSIIANSVAGSKLITGTDLDVGLVTASNVTATVIYSGNILPQANITYNIGSPTQRWKDLYLTGSTLYIDEAEISANGSAALLNGEPIATADNFDLDDISSYTDGVRQVFPLTYNLANVALTSPWQLSVAVNGIPLPAFNNSPNAYVIWQSFLFPANKGYTLDSNTSIKFAEAPGPRSDVYMRKHPGTTPTTIKVYPFKPIDIMIGY
jgi:hypothetical protein